MRELSILGRNCKAALWTWTWKRSVRADGNSTPKSDSLAPIEVEYDYAIEGRVLHCSNNNRLMYYETSSLGVGGGLLSTTYYDYYKDSLNSEAIPCKSDGNPTRIMTVRAGGGASQSLMGGGEESMEGGGESMMMGGLLNCPEGSSELSATRFEYAANGRAVTFAISESWCWDGDEENCPTDYDVNKVEHYRYNGARQRYLVQNLDPDDLDVVVENGEYWSDYDGDDVYGDFEIDEGNGVTIRSFEPGLARVDGGMSEGDGNTDYYHGDHLGTTRRVTAPNGDVIDSPVFTAFGERRTGGISDPFDRYGYVGAHGYQEQTGFFHEFSHVGHRLYQPRIGRFLQRDPIGISGGINVYAYARTPTLYIDPDGLTNKLYGPNSEWYKKQREENAKSYERWKKRQEQIKRNETYYTMEDLQDALDRERDLQDLVNTAMYCTTGAFGFGRKSLIGICGFVVNAAKDLANGN